MSSDNMRIRSFLLSFAGLLVFGPLLFPFPSFSNVAEKVGVFPTEIRGGISWTDYNRDGYPDLFIPAASSVFLYRNEGGMVFSDVTLEAGLHEIDGGNAGVFGDYDNDGCSDLYLVSDGEDSLFRNTCDGAFRNVTAETHLNGSVSDSGRGAAWGDFNKDGFLDLYVAEYSNDPNILYRNLGNGTFENVTRKAGVAGEQTCRATNRTVAKKNSFQPVWFDYDSDNDPDLYVSNDTGFYNILYRNNGDETFTDVTKAAGLCKSADGMGVTVGDYDSDGDFDIYFSNTGPNALWRNNGDSTFTDVAPDFFVTDFRSLGWGTSFFDYDNDGSLDLYVANGDVEHRYKSLADIGDVRIDRLYRNDGAFFSEVAAREKIEGNFPKKGLAKADYNKDGFEDLFVSGDGSFESSHRLYRNTPNGNNWLALKLEGVVSNRDGIGATISVNTKGKTLYRHVMAGDSFLSQSTLTQIFGLENSPAADRITITWPSGITQIMEHVPANQYLTITEPLQSEITQ